MSVQESEDEVSVAVGDVMGDSKQEIVFAEAGSGTVHVLGWTGGRIAPLTRSFRTGFGPEAGLVVGLPAYRP